MTKVMVDYDFLTCGDNPQISLPTCEDLGLPRDLTGEFERARAELERSHHSPLSMENSAFTLETMKGDIPDPRNPFSPFSQIPLPGPFNGYGYEYEPAFIRKRNERERERVRCVNEGYARLRDRLPLENKEKRISKVETLRSAIRYIKYLESLLKDSKRKDDSLEVIADEKTASTVSEKVYTTKRKTSLPHELSQSL